jgi:hypothetical protein
MAAIPSCKLSKCTFGLGICPGNSESAGKSKTDKVRKGNHYVRRLLASRQY